jgi:hypothetical protein
MKTSPNLTIVLPCGRIKFEGHFLDAFTPTPKQSMPRLNENLA